jgi:predicted phage terminase large subunit-like protein
MRTLNGGVERSPVVACHPGCQPQSDKIVRVRAQTAMIENGFHLPDTAPWLASRLPEMTVFPRGKHDDQADSTAQLRDWCKQGGGPMPRQP